ncbi:DUF4342 domain-containing protein [Kibdelosporangium aridum]|uniref:DUF4342 domain-containing protein n=1 Tax=Kibdelosporangium aridum TaxID=2030 RepID=A0A428ZB40_KIBAR|nr:DUF4342 domain-containing protein [Kibdelosporangium aridum]RSM85297.1 DUF4342 domain-containing protein [Kibdelosporangium aridum]
MTVTDRSTASPRLRGQALVEKVKELIHEGNVRRIIVKNDKVIAAPVVTAIGAVAALAGEWTIEVERQEAATDAKDVVPKDTDGEA